MRLLERDEIISLYNRFGAKQDTQGWYEDEPLAEMKRQMAFETADGVLELGMGTGRLAHEVVTELTPRGTRYLGLDLSPVMVNLGRNRLRQCDQAFAVVGDVRAPLPLRDNSVSHVYAAYVLDIFSEDEIRAVYDEVRRVLKPGGLFGAVSLTGGYTPMSRLTSSLWSAVHKLRPQAVGGCRPLELLACVPDEFELAHACKKVAGGIPSEVIVSRKPS
ncbi:class I SAM-dependent methyltransferase [Pyruvatibacter sp.]|uniref:class I SAM-dependent methyltransferase n=1 Tax=Pyruvatibacter sp. TaxID=1981328 RepID=UPI0032635842